MKHARALGALAVTAAVTLSACGDRGSTTGVPQATKVIEITMTDNAYSIKRLSAKVGDEFTFKFRNEGAAEHEAIIGTEKVQAEHEAEMNANATSGEMSDMPGMDHGGTNPGALNVPSGNSAEMTYRFTRGGEIVIGCHVPGHYKDGMKINVDVS